MHVQVRHHAARHELLAHEILRQADRLGFPKLARQADLDVAGELCVLAFLAGLHLVPQRAAIQPAVRRAVGQHDLPMHHAGLGRVVVIAVEIVVVQALGGTIGGGRNRAAPGGAADHLGGEVVNRHAVSTPLGGGAADPCG